MSSSTRDPAQGVYVISVAAELAGVHPQTLRHYERRGLIEPDRTASGARRYSDHDIDRLHRITELAAAGLNVAGIKLALGLQEQSQQLRDELAQLQDAPGEEPGRQAARPDGAAP